MAMLQLNYCPFCGNEFKVMDEICPFCNRDLSYLCTEDVLESRAASIILDCLDSMSTDFGRYVLASVLKGSASQVIMDNDLDMNPYYGDMGKLSKKEIINMIDSLIEGGFIDTVVKEEEIAHIRLAERGQLALDGKDIAWVRLPYKLAEQLEPLFTPIQKAVIPELRSMRKNLAHANDIPPYLVFNDYTLKDLALKLPTTGEELELVKGIKEVKAKMYSKEILETINWVLEDFNRKHDMILLEMDADPMESDERGTGVIYLKGSEEEEEEDEGEEEEKDEEEDEEEGDEEEDEEEGDEEEEEEEDEEEEEEEGKEGEEDEGEWGEMEDEDEDEDDEMEIINEADEEDGGQADVEEPGFELDEI